MHVIIGEKLYDADYVARHTHGFDELAALARAYDPARVAALTGIASEDIVQLAREYATTRPAVIRLNYGVQRSERGGAAVRAIAALPALTGSWKEVGGGLQLTTSQAFQFNSQGSRDAGVAGALGRSGAKRASSICRSWARRSRNWTPRRSRRWWSTTPTRPPSRPTRTKVLAGMRREDLFTVVLEQFQTDTADYADILLPSTTFLEHTDLYRAYGHYYLQLARPALDPPGEARSNVEVFRDLALRMGFDDQCFRDSEDVMIRSLLALRTPVPRRHHAGAPGPGAFHPPEHFRTRHALPAVCRRRVRHALRQVRVRRRIARLRAAHRIPLRRPGPQSRVSAGADLVEERRQHELHLRQPPARRRRYLAAPPERRRRPGARHPDRRPRARVQRSRQPDAARRRRTAWCGPGVARAPSVRWNKRAEDAANVNVLTSDRLTDMGGGPTFYSCLVEVERCGD